MSALLLTVAMLGAVPSLSGFEQGHPGILLAQADAPLNTNVDTVSPLGLQNEYDRLKETRPTLVGPVVLISVGAGLAILGTLIDVDLAFAGASAVVIGVTSVLFFTPAVILIVVGAVKLVARLNERKDIDQRLLTLQHRMDEALPPPPAPPPPPPGAQNTPWLDSGMLVATF